MTVHLYHIDQRLPAHSSMKYVDFLFLSFSDLPTALFTVDQNSQRRC